MTMMTIQVDGCPPLSRGVQVPPFHDCDRRLGFATASMSGLMIGPVTRPSAWWTRWEYEVALTRPSLGLRGDFLSAGREPPPCTKICLLLR